MDIQINVTLRTSLIDPDGSGSIPDKQLQRAVQAAILHAMKYGESEGFVHDLDDQVGIEVLNVTVDETSKLLIDLANDFEIEGCTDVGTLPIEMMNKVHKVLGWDPLCSTCYESPCSCDCECGKPLSVCGGKHPPQQGDGCPNCSCSLIQGATSVFCQGCGWGPE
jgi:hypothetical protein